MSAELPFSLPPGLTFEADVEPATWIDERLAPLMRTEGVRVGELIPTGFESYARVFHPAYRTQGWVPVRWSDIAAEQSRVAHPEMQFLNVVGTVEPAARGLEPPTEGDLPSDQCAVLAKIVEQHTAVPDPCWFAVWDGYGFFGGGRAGLTARGDETWRARRARERTERARQEHERRLLDALPTFDVHPTPGGGAHRSYLLFRGRVSMAGLLDFDGHRQSANLWWPEDRAWCVSTEVDGNSTYVGGSAEMVRDILADPRLEAMPSSVDHRFDWWGDRLNPVPPGMADR